ncbi:ExeM/NucH family extracellular endonuclease [Deinococcus maricopensis]|uniref:Endonuclease/exonuclease/phosphatase n=1 Tax=Deinococcus maricopensis (strain DSM 21211 / LMG 22137 / NRRL B-23946 / LB-34) TaxID=709986 RepID=E8U3X9_DEIML|nr:ExeM/NucH family extracellular endonuclease [Deinococcus maricopensis]ADV65673.1 Endonuclease/exonuclease/phosphatase [Deinococcus maricopensis DSM 21211]
MLNFSHAATRRAAPYALLTGALLLSACGQQAPAPTTGSTTTSVRLLSIPTQVKLVTLDVTGKDSSTQNDSRTYTATLEGGVASINLSNVAKGAYTLVARGYDDADRQVTLYKTTVDVNLKDATPVVLRMNRVTSAITVNALGLSSKSDVVIARVGGLEARLNVQGTTATGTVQGVPSGRDLSVLVQGLDQSGAVQQQGNATTILSESDVTTSVTLKDVAAPAPTITAVTAPESVKKNDPFSVRVQAQGDGLAGARVEWGDGSSDTYPLTGSVLDATYTHVFSAPGARNVSVTVTNASGTSGRAVRTVNVIDTTDTPVSIDLGADITPATLEVTGVPAGAQRVNATVTAPVGAQALRRQDLKRGYTLELIPRANGTWSATLGLPAGFTYGVTYRAISADGTGTDGSTQSVTPTLGQPNVFSAPFTASGSVSCPAPGGTLTTIGAVQGSGATSPLVGQGVTVRGIVTLDAQSGLRGFYLQDLMPDANPDTSDGVFVYTGAAPQTVKAGDVVQFTATVKEFKGASDKLPGTGTQLDTLQNVSFCGTTTVPAPVTLSFPLANASDLERYEGMRVTIPTPLTVTDNYTLGRYGELGLSSGGRVFNPTNGQPGTVDAARRTIRLDDLNTAQNPASVPYLTGSDVTATRRTGDTVTGLTGVVHYANDAYKIQPTTAPVFESANPRQDTPKAVGGTLKVAGANVLNYFTTFGSNDRGANSAYEFARQKAKIVAALKGLDADVVTLMEIQNDSDAALNDLTGALNAAYGQNVYAALSTGKVGTDAIRVAMIYKPARVTLVGAPRIDQNSVYSRPPVAQTFRDLSSGGTFTVIANHFKSKGSCPNSGDTDNGQGCWNTLRVQQAQAVLAFAEQLRASTGDPDVLIMGDLNAYGDEDPIRTLVAGGFESLNKRIPAEDRYSYQFSGQFGYLDHALASTALAGQVTGITEWHINSDEPVFLDYNVEFKNNPECKSTTCTTPDLYAPTAFRASDHDPVLVGLNLTADSAEQPLGVTLSAPGTATTGQAYTVTVSAPGNPSSVQVNWGDGATDTLTGGATTATHTYATAGTYTVTATAERDGTTRTAASTVTVTDATTPTPSGHVVISQVATAGPAGASDEYIELYNPTSANVNLSGCKLVYRSAAGTSDTNLSAALSANLPAGKYWLAAGSAYPGTADAKFSAGLSATAGGVALICNDAVVDSVGYGTATNAFVEGAAAPAPSSTQAIFRANGADTDNNKADFQAAARNPRTSSH